MNRKNVRVRSFHSVASFSDLLVALIDRLKVDDIAIVVGTSRGGYLGAGSALGESGHLNERLGLGLRGDWSLCLNSNLSLSSGLSLSSSGGPGSSRGLSGRGQGARTRGGSSEGTGTTNDAVALVVGDVTGGVRHSVLVSVAKEKKLIFQKFL